MRQAGRYLPEYRAHAREGRQLHGAGHQTDYATEVTLQPLERYPLDAAILFSDILTVPDAMGLGLSFAQGEGPRFASPCATKPPWALQVPDMDKLRYVFDAVTSIRRALNGRVPLIGFSGSPWTLACYMVEGAGSDDYRLVKTMLYSRPDLMHHMLAINADAVAAYLNAQIDAGAQAVMIFDSWGGVLADGAFQAFSLAYTARVLAQLKRGHDGQIVPRIVFTKGGGLWLEDMKRAGLRGAGPGLDMNLGTAGPGGLVGGGQGAAGQPRPQRAVCPARRRSRRSGKVLEALARLTPTATPAARAHLQPGPRHQPAHPAGTRARCWWKRCMPIRADARA
jgi:uroporphyrinogen decarboxylase